MTVPRPTQPAVERRRQAVMYKLLTESKKRIIYQPRNSNDQHSRFRRHKATEPIHRLTEAPRKNEPPEPDLEPLRL